MSDNVEAVKKIMQEQIDGLTAELALRTAEAKNQAVTIKDAVERIEMLNSALAARDVIIGVKDGALKMIIFHNQLEARKPMGEQHPFKLLSDIIGICDEALKPLSTNEVAEAVEGMRVALDAVLHDIKDTDFGKFKICDRSGLMVSEALALYDKALKGVK